MTRDPAQALEDIVGLGCERILTSGTKASAVEGAALIRELVTHAGGRIVVMPGAGVTAQNIAALAAATGAHEFHASAKRQLASGMRYRRGEPVGMDDGEVRSGSDHVRALVAALASGG